MERDREGTEDGYQEMVGGRMISEGLYGCVYQPTLSCKPGTEQVLPGNDSDKSISKLILKEDADLEFKIAKRIARIPMHRQFFAIPYRICEPRSVQKEEVKECDAVEKKEWKEVRVLDMVYAGKPMHQASFHLPQFDLMRFAVHLIAAGTLLGWSGIVHRDLHQGNILVDSMGVPRIIDFNLSIMGKVEAKDLSHKPDLRIAQEPPDSTLVNGVAHKQSISSIIQGLVKKPILLRVRALLGGNEREWKESLKECAKDEVIRHGDFVGWFEKYHAVIDSWAIGINICDLILRLALWPAFARQFESIKRRLVPVLRKMCALNPSKRMTCLDALKELDSHHIVLRKVIQAE